MDSFKVHDVRVEKANAISRYRRIQRITTLFRFLEIFVFLIVVSRFSTQFAFPLKLSGECVRGISVTLIGPKFVFVVGNAIVVVLFFISGQFSSQKADRTTDFYDEYVEKCRNYNQRTRIKEDHKQVSDAYERSVCNLEEKSIHRVHSENRERAVTGSEERRRDLRRCMSEKCRKSVDRRREAVGGGSPYAEDEMSSEEFRRTVEAFIARQQRFLREEEGFTA